MKVHIQDNCGYIAPKTFVSQCDIYNRSSVPNYRNISSIYNVANAWKCVWKMFTGATNQNYLKDFAANVLKLIDRSPSPTELRDEFNKIKSNSCNFEGRKSKYLIELLKAFKDTSYNVSRLQAMKDIVLDGFEMNKDSASAALNYIISTSTTRKELDSLLILNDVLFNKPVPPIANIRKVYKDQDTNIYNLKCELFKSEIDDYLDTSLSELSKESPPTPPPIFGSNENIEERKEKLMEALGGDLPHLLELTDDQIEEASKSMLKCTWLLSFYKKERDMNNYPRSGRMLLNLSDEECTKVFSEVIDARIYSVKDNIMFPVLSPGVESQKQFLPKVALLSHCRHDQFQLLCKHIADWARIECDRVRRLRELYGVDIVTEELCLPLHRVIVGGGKPMLQSTYLSPEDDPNYENPDLSEYGRMMESTRMNEEIKDDFVPTDIAIRKKYLDLVAKDLEPYEHLSPKELSDLILRNVRKEYQFAEAVYKRKLRKKEFEAYSTNCSMQEGAGGELPAGEDEASHRMKSPSPPSESGSREFDRKIPREDYLTSRQQLLTDAIVFLHNYEHFQWQYLSSMYLPIESIVYVDDSGDKSTNPRPPKLTFRGMNYNTAFKFLNEYLANKDTSATKFRKTLNDPFIKYDVPDRDKAVIDNMLLFGEDPLFLRKDHEMILELTKMGAGLQIETKMPGFNTDIQFSEKQKETIWYRMNISQPAVQMVCNNCGYTIFSHSIQSYDDETLINTEYDDFISDDDFKCPICSGHKHDFKEAWTTGTRGYTPEPYARVGDDEGGDDDD